MNRDLLIISIIGSFGGLIMGFDITMFTGAFPFFSGYSGLLGLKVGWIVIVTLAGTVVGARLIGRFADKFGRRDLLKMMALLLVLSSLGTGLANNSVIFLIARFITGLAIGAITVLSPVYLTEIAPPHFRGRIVGGFLLNLFIGIIIALFFIHLISDSGTNDWRWMFFSTIVPALVFILLLFYTVRTPRWLTSKGFDRETSFVTRLINSEKDIDELMKEIQDTFYFTGKAAFTSVLEPKYGKMLKMGLTIAIFNALSGGVIICFLFNLIKGPPATMGLSVNPFMITAIAGIVLSFAGLSIIDRLGRKKILLVGSAFTAILMLILGALLVLGYNHSLLSALLIAIIPAVYFNGQGMSMFVVIPEILPNMVRAKGTGFILSIYWLISLLMAVVMQNFIDGPVLGYIFICTGILTTVAFYFFTKLIRETHGEKLEILEKNW